MRNFAGKREFQAPFALRLRTFCAWTCCFLLVVGNPEFADAQYRSPSVSSPQGSAPDRGVRPAAAARIEQIGSGAVWETLPDSASLAWEDDPAGWMADPASLGQGEHLPVWGQGPVVGAVDHSQGLVWDGVEWVEPWYPNRPYLVPRVVDRLRWRPLFPNRPHLRGAWSGGPPLEQPRTFWLNPFALQQGVGNFLFRGNQPADTGSLGFPFSMVPSHMVDRVPRPYLGHGQPYVGPRHIDRGQPLVGTSWANRPYSVEGFTGALLAWNLTEDQDQTNGTISGVRLGWDFEHFWGAQFGFGFGRTRTDPGGGDVSIRIADVSVLYYPWGDARWRPYTGLGLGFGKYSFQDLSQTSVDQVAFQIPLSIGVKYAFRPWWGLRLDATNYLVLPANDLSFMNHVALSMAAELRFGGQRRSYFPYSPSIQLR